MLAAFFTTAITLTRPWQLGQTSTSTALEVRPNATPAEREHFIAFLAHSDAVRRASTGAALHRLVVVRQLRRGGRYEGSLVSPRPRLSGPGRSREPD